MPKTKKVEKNMKNIYEGKIFHSKSDLKYFLFLKECVEENLFFSYGFEQDELGHFHAKNIEIDGSTFDSRTDVDYFVFLQRHKLNGTIDDFCLDKNTSGERTKYFAKKVEIDHYLFDSKIEANYYIHLLERKRNREIRDFEVKPTFILQPSFKKYGKTIKKIEYIPDFQIYNFDDSSEVIDVKGFVTPDFKIKKKLFDFKYPDIELKLVKFVEKFGGWITFTEWETLKRIEKKEKKKKGG